MFSVRLPTGETGPRIFCESQLLTPLNTTQYSMQDMKTEE